MSVVCTLFPSRPLSLRSVLFGTGETFIDYQENDIRSVPGLPGAQPGLALQLPRTFGSVCVFEKYVFIFTTYFSLI